MLFLKMIRDIKKNFVQFIVIFLMAFMGTFVFSGISAEWYGIEKIVKDYTAEANFADIWVYGKNFSKDDLDTIKNLKGIIEVERRVSIEGIGDFANNPKLELHFLEDNSINKPKLVEGEEIDLNKSEGIWIDKNFAKEKKLKIGDTLKCTSNGVSIEKEILGIIESPEYIYYANEEDLWPDYAKIGYAYLSIEAFPYKDKAPYTTMLVKANRTDTSKLEDAINNLEDKFMKKGLQMVVDGIEPETIREILDLEIGQFESREMQAANIFNIWGSYAPAFGMLGTLVGLVQMLQNLTDMDSIAKGMGVALLTTFYGSLVANLILTPIGTNLKQKCLKEVGLKEMMVEGILAIQSGVNPRIIEEKLLTYLDPNDRLEYLTSNSESAEGVTE